MEYTDAVRRKEEEKGASIQPAGEIAQWLDWARRQADQLDPLGWRALHDPIPNGRCAAVPRYPTP